jgi:transcriptional regulator with XRE-family HTH domain
MSTSSIERVAAQAPTTKKPTLQEIVRKMARRAPQTEVAAALGVTQDWVSKMCAGDIRRPRISTCRLLAARLNMTLDDILDLLPEKKDSK